MARYVIAVSRPDGESFAVRLDDSNRVTGVCGPLHHSETSARGADYDYDTDPEVLAWWESHDWGHVKDLEP